MPTLWIFALLMGLAALGYLMGRQRALASAGGDARRLHSRPAYYGYSVALSAFVPALAVLLIWLLAQPVLIDRSVSQLLPQDLVPEGSSVGLLMSDVRRVADGLDSAVSQGILSAKLTPPPSTPKPATCANCWGRSAWRSVMMSAPRSLMRHSVTAP